MHRLPLIIVAMMIYASRAYRRRQKRVTPRQEADALREADERLTEMERDS